MTVPTDPSRAPKSVRIIAALVNPVGAGPERETVTLINASPQPIDLTGWEVADRSKRRCPLPAGILPAGATMAMSLSNGAALGNHGGAVTVLDPQGLKVHGVSYTADQIHNGGWTIVF